MAPSIAVGMIPGMQNVGLAAMGMGAAGNATKEALANGATDEAAYLYGGAVGAVKMATEKIADGVAGLFGKGAADDMIKAAARKIATTEAGQNTIIFLADVLGEGLEEWLAEYAEAYANKLIIGQDGRTFDEISEDAITAAAMGALTSVIMSGAGVLKNNASEIADAAVEATTGVHVSDSGTSPNAGLEKTMVNAGINAMTQNAQDTPVNAPQQGVVTPKADGVQAQKNATGTEADVLVGDVTGRVTASGEARAVVEKVRGAIPQLQSMAPVAEVTGTEMQTGGSVTDRIMTFASKIGNKVMRPNFGEVFFSRSKIKGSMLGHGFGTAKFDTFAAVPAVIQNGQQIDYQQNWKGRGYDTYLFAAPITYRGATDFVGVVVAKDTQSNRYYLHEVVDGNGNLIYSRNNGASETIKTVVPQNEGRGSSDAPLPGETLASASDGRAVQTDAYDTVAEARVSEGSIPQTPQNSQAGNVADQLSQILFGTQQQNNTPADDVLVRAVRGELTMPTETQRGTLVNPEQAAIDSQAQENAPVQAGRVTTIQNPYQGEVPVQAAHSTEVQIVSDSALKTAEANLQNARIAAIPSGGRGVKTLLTNIYKSTFRPSLGVEVNGMTFNDKPYLVDIHSNVPGKVISDPNLSAEKLALLEMLPTVVQNGEYVGSGEYINPGNSRKEVIRYD